VAGLIILCTTWRLGPGPAMDYFMVTAESLHNPAVYTNAVLPADAGGTSE